jgi:hypothetical protein
MLRACDFCRSNGSTFQRRKQNAPKGVPNGVTVAGLKRLGSEFCVGISSRALVLPESFRHFKTTVTDWHIVILDCRMPICDLRRESHLGENAY